MRACRSGLSIGGGGVVKGIDAILLAAGLVGVSALGAAAEDQATVNARTLGAMIAITGPAPPGASTVGFGSGWFADSRGDVVTAEHVVAGCRRVNVWVSGSGPVEAHLVATDHRLDLALLTTGLDHTDWLDLESSPPLPEVIPGLHLAGKPGDAGTTAVSGLGQRDWLVGFPGARSLDPILVTFAPLGVLVSDSHDWRLVYGGAAINGESGSPMVTSSGLVAGVASEEGESPGQQPHVISGVGISEDRLFATPGSSVRTFLSGRLPPASGSTGRFAGSISLPFTEAASVAGSDVGRTTVKVFCFH